MKFTSGISPLGWVNNLLILLMNLFMIWRFLLHCPVAVGEYDPDCSFWLDWVRLVAKWEILWWSSLLTNTPEDKRASTMSIKRRSTDPEVRFLTAPQQQPISWHHYLSLIGCCNDPIHVNIVLCIQRGLKIRRELLGIFRITLRLPGVQCRRHRHRLWYKVLAYSIQSSPVPYIELMIESYLNPVRGICSQAGS